MNEAIVVYLTVGSAAEGERLARALVEERLAACVNRIGHIYSTYRWQGQVEQSQEELLMIKTLRDVFPALEKRVGELHSYAVPEIIAVSITEGSQDYLSWLRDQVTARG